MPECNYLMRTWLFNTVRQKPRKHKPNNTGQYPEICGTAHKFSPSAFFSLEFDNLMFYKLLITENEHIFHTAEQKILSIIQI